MSSRSPRGVLLYTLWSGFRASVLTDFIQVMAMLGAVAIIVPFIFFAAGFPAAFETGSAEPHTRAGQLLLQ